MTASKIFLMILAFGIIVQTTQAGVIIIYPGNDLNEILNNSKGGDTVLVKAGRYKNISLSNKKYSEENPLVVRTQRPPPVRGSTPMSRGSTSSV